MTAAACMVQWHQHAATDHAAYVSCVLPGGQKANRVCVCVCAGIGDGSRPARGAGNACSIAARPGGCLMCVTLHVGSHCPCVVCSACLPGGPAAAVWGAQARSTRSKRFRSTQATPHTVLGAVPCRWLPGPGMAHSHQRACGQGLVAPLVV